MAIPLTLRSGPVLERERIPAADALARWLKQPSGASSPGTRLSALINDGLDRFPYPGEGGTALRWRLLATLSRCDLSFAKLVEAHADALAILHELGGEAPPGARLAIWASELPQARLAFSAEGECWQVHGRKAWCSGAWDVSHALVTGWNAAGEQCLALVDLEHPSVRRTREGWAAVGMAATQSFDVTFDGTPGIRVGWPGDYLSRPGFWHGAMGIAACWYGATTAVADALWHSARSRAEAHRDAHLGRVSAALLGARCALHETAAQIDCAPRAPYADRAMALRAVVEQASSMTMEATGRALGATPFCRDARFARLMADLPVFLRQSHAERDLALLGRHLAAADATGWNL